MPDIIQTNFTAGELSPRLRGRIDLNKYHNGLAELKNGIVLTHGPVRKRNGSRFVNEVKIGQHPVRLLTFEFSDGQNYVLEFGHFYVRFYMNGGLIMRNGIPYEIATPYAGVELEELKYAQSADMIFLFHPDHPIQALQRYAHDYWLLEPFEVKNGPWLPENQTETTISNSGYIGEISLVAVPADGKELVDNGIFQAQPLAEQFENPEFNYPDTSWDWGTNWEHDPDTRHARATSSNDSLTQTLSLIPGKVYLLTVNVVQFYGGQLIPVVGGTQGSPITTTGVHSQYIVAGSTNTAGVTGNSLSAELSLISLRDVASDTAWQWGDGWIHDYAGQAAKHVSNIEPLSQDINTLAGKKYVVKFKVKNRTAGSVTPYIGSQAGTAVSVNTVSTQYIEAPYNGAPIRFVPTSNFNGSVTEVSVRLYGAASRVFYEEHVGSVWKLNHDSGRNIESVIIGNPTRIKTTNHHLKEGDIVILKSFNDQYWSQLNGMEFAVHVIDRDWFTIPYDTYQFSTPSGGQWTKKHGGYCRIKAVISGTVAKATVISAFHSTGPTTRWAEGAWSGVRGYPSCGCFFEERLYAAGTYDSPQTLWASAVGDYNNFILGSRDDDGLSFTLSSNSMDAIHWMSAWRIILIGTAGGLWRLMGATINEPITPTSFSVRKEIAFGTSAWQPVTTSVAVLCADKRRKRIVEIAYNFELDSYVSQDMQILSDHINLSGVKCFDLQEHPDLILWCVLDDGTLTGMTYQRTHEVVAWHRHITDGQYESVCVIPGPQSDQVWVVVKRQIEGIWRRYIEYFDLDDRNLADTTCLDSWLPYSGQPTRLLSGLSHLNGKAVRVLGDGVDLGEYVVTNGSIQLDKEVSQAVVGLPYDFVLTTMPVEFQALGGTTQAKWKLLYTAAVMLYRAADLEIGSQKWDAWQPIKTNGLASGMYFVGIPAGHMAEGQITLRQNSAMPATIVGLIIKVTHGEK